MKKEIADKWIQELRTSGKYKQGQGELRSYDGHCCLGVLCEIGEKEGVGIWDLDLFCDNQKSFSDRWLSRTSLTEGMKKWAEMNSCEGEISISNLDMDNELDSEVYEILQGVDGYLTTLNDRGMPFAKIADFIERHWKTL